MKYVSTSKSAEVKYIDNIYIDIADILGSQISISENAISTHLYC